VFAQKDRVASKTWMASKDAIRVGRAKWKKAILDLALCIATNWEFRDTLGVIEPSYWEQSWIKETPKNELKML
jgi:hypothetical protein